MRGERIMRGKSEGLIIPLISHYTSIVYTHPSLSRKLLQPLSLNQMYEKRTQATIYTLSYGSKALVLYEIRRVSIEVQEYRSIVRNEGNDY